MVLNFILLFLQFFIEIDTGKVTRVVDGDTLVVQMEEEVIRVRLIGVDTPESVHPKLKLQFFGKEASEYTKQKLLNKTIYLTYDKNKYDYYKRTLAYVWYVQDAKIFLFNQQVIFDGYGKYYGKYKFNKYAMIYFSINQKMSQILNKGMWHNE